MSAYLVEPRKDRNSNVGATIGNQSQLHIFVAANNFGMCVIVASRLPHSCQFCSVSAFSSDSWKAIFFGDRTRMGNAVEWRRWQICSDL
eukprot:SAG31_NODE_801_length_12013_cov_23.812070_17_plen_89_part_00